MSTLLPASASIAASPDVSVVVCTYNRAPFLAQALASLVRQQTRGRTYEIVVVDDGSTDNTPEIVRRAQHESSIEIRYVRQANAGIGNARNRGVAEARASWIAFLDDDELAEKSWLHELLNTATASGADCVGGPTIPKPTSRTEIEPVGAICKLLGLNAAMTADASRLSFFDYLRFRLTRISLPGGGNALARKKLIDGLGGFRPVRYGEDLDFFRRAQDCGARFAISSRARVYHLIPAERLTPDYLYGLARLGGASQAGLDKQGSSTRAGVVALLRLAHLIAITIPFLLWYTLRRRKSSQVSWRCSLLFAATYIRRAIQSEKPI